MSGYLDPAFLAAYNAPNYYQMQNIAPVDNTRVATTVPVEATTFKGNNTQAPSEKKSKGSSSTAWTIIGTVATVGAAVLCRKAYLNGAPAKKIFPRIADGFRTMWKSRKKKLGQFTNPEKFSQTQINGKEVYSVPKRSNHITSNVANKLDDIGIGTTSPALTTVNSEGKTVLTNGIKIQDGIFGDPNATSGLYYRFHNGKLKSIKYNGKDIMNSTEPAMLDIKKQVAEQINKHMKGESLEQLTNLRYCHLENNTVKYFTLGKQGETPKLTSAASKYFTRNSDAVQAYVADNQKAKAALKAISEGKKDGWKIAEAEHTCSLGTFRLKNGEIVGIRQADGYFNSGTDRFKRLQLENPEVFSNVLKQTDDQLTNIVRVLA